jgi:hypothetical protein
VAILARDRPESHGNSIEFVGRQQLDTKNRKFDISNNVRSKRSDTVDIVTLFKFFHVSPNEQ